MSFAETFRTALKSLLSNKIRSFLTMLGVIIGVFAVISLVALGRGIQNYITGQFEALGSNLIFVTPGKVGVGKDPALALSNNKLSEKHIELIKTYAGDLIADITPSIRVGKNVQYKTKEYFATVVGGDASAKIIFNRKMTAGNFFTEADVRSKRKVAAIGPITVKELFSSSDPIGKRIKIENTYYTVIGVMESKGPDFDDTVSIPYTSAKETFNIEYLSTIIIKAKNPDDIDLLMRRVRIALMRDLKEDEFTVLSQQDILSSIQNILKALTLGIGAIAAISLLVGGIGIMNIMLVSVTERIKEIGLRKALGATPFSIGLQFLMESVMLSVSGGFIGLMLGELSSLIARNFIKTEVPLWSVGLAFGFSVAVGMLFGTYPAYKASKKDPIEALRYE